MSHLNLSGLSRSMEVQLIDTGCIRRTEWIESKRILNRTKGGIAIESDLNGEISIALSMVAI
jgi:hypothetical protein